MKKIVILGSTGSIGQNTVNIINKFKPEIVGLTSMTSTIYNAQDVINKIKKKNGHTELISGIFECVVSFNFTRYPEELLKRIYAQIMKSNKNASEYNNNNE